MFLLSDGVVPSNKTQGYVLRRVIRRAIGQGRKLGIEQPFIGQAGEVVQQMYKQTYPQMDGAEIINLLKGEESKFLETLNRGLKEVQKFVDGLSTEKLSLDEVAAKAFDFYQTLGLPADVFVDELMSRAKMDYSIDERLEIQEKYQELFAKHQDLSREGSVGMFKGGLGSHGDKEIQYHTTTHLLQQALRDVLGDTVIQRGSNITPERLRFDFTSESRLTDEQKRQVEEIVNVKIRAGLPVSFTILPIAEAEETGAIHAFGEKYGDSVKVYSVGDGERPVGNADPDQKPEIGNEADGVKLAEEVDYILPRSEVYSREFCGGPHVANTNLIRGTFKIQKDEKISRDVVRIKAVLE
jgi:alanyl-tRNA synthetase